MDKSIGTKDDFFEKKFVSDALINLYAAHVHSLLYSYNHPLISDALKNAFQGLQKAFRKKPAIRIEISGGMLTVEGHAPDGDALVLGHFASWLGSRNIKSMSFEDGLTRRELIAFHNILSTRKQTVADLGKTMAEKSITNIKVNLAAPSGDHATKKPLDQKVGKGLITEYESTMYHLESDQAKAPFFIRPEGANPLDDSAQYGLVKDDESKPSHSQDTAEVAPFIKVSGGVGNEQATAGYERYAECVEAMLEHDISGEERDIIKGIPPEEMAHLLNTMFFTAPDERLAEKITNAYFDKPGEAQGEDAAARCRIFLAGLKTSIRPPFLLRCASVFGDGVFPGKDETGVMYGAEKEPHVPSGADYGADKEPEAVSVPKRTIDGSDFQFDSVVHGNVVVHDIEIPAETACTFNEERLAHFKKEGVLDALSLSLRTADGDAEIQTSIIAECTSDAINEAYFDVLLQILESPDLEEDSYLKLGGRLALLVELFSEEGEFEKLLDLLNVLKTQSMQGRWSVHAAVMMRKIFSADRTSARVVDALRQYGRKQRETAYRITGALRLFVIPHLLDALGKESDTSTRRFIISLVASVKGDAIDHISKRLNENSWYIIRNMLYLIRECRGTGCTPAVKGFLEHEVPLVRLEALRTLLSFQDPDADACVIKFLGSGVSQLKQGAIRLAGSYRIKHTVPYLLNLLREKDTGKGSNLKRLIVRALGRIGDSRAADDLLNICKSADGLRKDAFERLQVEIFRSLHNYPVAAISPIIDYGMSLANKEIAAIIIKLRRGYGPAADK